MLTSSHARLLGASVHVVEKLIGIVAQHRRLASSLGVVSLADGWDIRSFVQVHNTCSKSATFMS